MAKKKNARERIIAAAEEIVSETGAVHMTLDAVAARAKVSKGGLLYHFPSQHHLGEAMLAVFLARIEALRAEALAQLPDTPSRPLKAYILTWFTFGRKYLQTASALLAALSRDPSLLETVRQAHRTFLMETISGAPHPERVGVLMLATEGVWMSELLGISPLLPRERQRIRRLLLQLADQWDWAGPAPLPPRRASIRRSSSKAN